MVFAFQSTGGRRENGRAVSIYLATPKLAGGMTAGALDGSTDWQPVLERAFAGTRYPVTVSRNMGAWLKCHTAFILPIAFACYFTGGAQKKIAWNRAYLFKMIDAIAESYRVLRACGCPVEPREDEDFILRHRQKCYWMLRLMAATPIGRLACSDHAMSAKAEIRRLYDDFCVYKERAGLVTPAWDELARVMKLPARPGGDAAVSRL